MRGMFTDNHPLILLITMIVSVVHIVLDVLAIKNDIAFWRAADNLTGISVHTLATSLISEIIVRVYGGVRIRSVATSVCMITKYRV